MPFLPQQTLDLGKVRSAQRSWRERAPGERLAVIGRMRALLAARTAALAESLARISKRPTEEKLTAEIMPVLAAARFLEKEAAGILAPRELGRRGRPLWLTGIKTRVLREPCGVIAIVGPSNYPFFLPAVQALQALAAGNAAILKPGRNGLQPAQHLWQLLQEAGLPEHLLTVTDEAVAHVAEIISLGVDKVIFTGSTDAGRAVVRMCGEALVPVIAELSGEDPAIVCADADLDMAAQALAFGRRLNAGNSCIAPQRIIAPAGHAPKLTAAGGDLPFVPMRDAGDAIAQADASPYALGATVFTRSDATARALAEKLNAGVVVINDMIAPTADPRIPFGGRKLSGFGVTRGREGLLEMTVPKVIQTNHSRWRPHFQKPRAQDTDILAHYLHAAYGTGIGARLRSAARLLRHLIKRSTHPS